MKSLKILFLSVMTLGSVVGLMGREVDFLLFVVGKGRDGNGRTLAHTYALYCDRSPEELKESYFKAINQQSIIEDMTGRELIQVSKEAYKLYVKATEARRSINLDVDKQLLVEDKFGQTPIDIIKKRISEVNPGVERGRCESMLARFDALLNK